MSRDATSLAGDDDLRACNQDADAAAIPVGDGVLRVDGMSGTRLQAALVEDGDLVGGAFTAASVAWNGRTLFESQKGSAAFVTFFRGGTGWFVSVQGSPAKVDFPRGGPALSLITGSSVEGGGFVCDERLWIAE